MHAGGCRGQGLQGLDPWELELQAVVICPVWVLVTKKKGPLQEPFMFLTTEPFLLLPSLHFNVVKIINCLLLVFTFKDLVHAIYRNTLPDVLGDQRPQRRLLCPSALLGALQSVSVRLVPLPIGRIETDLVRPQGIIFGYFLT